MKKYLLLFITSFLFAQEATRWQDHFSYANVVEIIEVDGLIYAAAENGIFTYNPLSGELQKNSKVNDLNSVGLTALAYNLENDFVMIGYENGELDFLGAVENYNFLEIPLDDFQGSKQVNHISSYQNSAVLSGEFGVATFNLVNLEFDETAFFTNPDGSNIVVNETAVRDGVIYAASENGIYTHPLNDFIPNFPAWEQPVDLPVSNFNNIELLNNEIYASTNSQVYRYDGATWSLFGNFSNIRDLRFNNEFLTLTLSNEIRVFDSSGILINTFSLDNLNTSLSVNSVVYAGSRINGVVNLSNGDELFPDGPFNNNSYGITAHQGQIFIAPGGARNYNAPTGNADGYSHFNSEQWIHNSAEELNNARDIIQITVNPIDTTEVWVSTWNQNRGLFKMKSGVLEAEYDPSNSALVEIDRIGGSVFDDNGTLWVAQSFTGSSGVGAHYLVSFNPDGTSTGHSLGGVAFGGGGVNTPIIDNNGFIYIPGTRGGGVMVTDGGDERYLISEEPGQGSLPSARVRNIALDQNNRLWIVTLSGLRVFSNPIEQLQSGDYETESIIIEQNGIAEELFFETSLVDVEVDGANRKWIATEGAGVFYLSENGEETIENFTISNSPLPSNNILDIDIDESTGRVYFATALGVVSYGSDITTATNSFGDVLAYPNPVRPEFTGNVVIRGLADDADVRITDVVGNLIFRGTASGGIIEWDTNNFNGQPVASGIYLVLMTNSDASETAYTKIAIVR